MKVTKQDEIAQLSKSIRANLDNADKFYDEPYRWAEIIIPMGQLCRLVHDAMIGSDQYSFGKYLDKKLPGWRLSDGEFDDEDPTQF